MPKFTTSLMRTAALAAVLGSFAFAAQAQDAMSPAPADQATEAAPATTSAATHGGMKQDRMDVETRIKTLHDKLNITSAQEADWAKVAQTMRDNETEVHDLVAARHQDPESMTAIDDLTSYEKIVQAHADGLQKMITAFQTVYDEMSDAQKKNADQVFGSFEGHHHHGKGKAAAKSSQ